MKTRYQILMSVAVAAMLSACGGGGSDAGKETASIEGTLVDAPVSGVEYRCGRIDDITGEDGRFVCEKLPVEFRVGGVLLGEIRDLPSDGVVTPQDLAGVPRERVDAKVTKLALFLQSLDDDGVREEKIRIEEKTRKRMKKFNFSVCDVAFEKIQEALEEAEVPDMVSREEAIEHLREQMHALGVEKLHVDLPDPETPSADSETPSADEDSGAATPYDPESPGDVAPEDPDSSDDGSAEGSDASDTDHEEGASGDSPDSSEDSSDYEAFKEATLEVINEARAEGRECGEYGYFPPAPPVSWNDHLYASALEHSKDMAISDTFSHTGSGTSSDVTAQALHPGEGSSVSERIEYNGYGDWQRYGENIAAGTVMDEASEAMKGWLNSPGHCKNIMNPDFKEVGMAVYYFEDSHYKHYWTQDFATAR